MISEKQEALELLKEKTRAFRYVNRLCMSLVIFINFVFSRGCLSEEEAKSSRMRRK